MHVVHNTPMKKSGLKTAPRRKLRAKIH
jgi:hypothetical protein